jgi:uncharacterized phage-associated protein
MITRLPLDPEKLVAAMLYIAHRVTDPTKWRIGKLIFLGDFAHLGRYGRPIVGGRYCAMPNGPVPSEALNLMNGILNQDIEAVFWGTGVESSFEIGAGDYPLFIPKTEPNLEALSDSDVEMLDRVIADYGTMSFYGLSDFVHGLPAYLNATEREPDSRNPSMDYEEFFEDNPFVAPGSKEELIETYALSRAFPQLGVQT